MRTDETNQSQSYITLKNANDVTDSLVQSFGHIHGIWTNGTVNLNFRRQFDSTGRELTADADYIYYKSTSDQLFRELYLQPRYETHIIQYTQR